MSESQEFVKNASLTIKSIGHNKYQIVIKELRDQINKLTINLLNKEDDICLFKNNLKDLHIQLQEKNTNIINSSKKLQTTIESYDNIKLKYDELNNSNQQNCLEYEKHYECLMNEKIQLHNIITNNSKSTNKMYSDYDEINIKFKENLTLLNNKTSSYIQLDKLYTDIILELNLCKDLNLKKDKEIGIIKLEVEKSKNETVILKTILYEKHEYLKDLTKKYKQDEGEKIPEEKVTQQEKQEKQEEIPKLKRGIKISRR
jgi:hypothetical protein